MKMHSIASTVSLSNMTDRWDMVFINADIQNIRKFYENEDILVRHFVAPNPNGTKDATVHTIFDILVLIFSMLWYRREK